jgi:hypothetical protein
MDSENTPSGSAGASESSVRIKGTRTKVSFADVDFSRSQQNLRFYANHVATSSTLFDIRVLFSDVDPSPDGTKLIAVGTLTILMSPEIAEVLHKSLGNLLENYKADYGKSRIPEDAIKFSHERISQPGV